MNIILLYIPMYAVHLGHTLDHTCKYVHMIDIICMLLGDRYHKSDVRWRGLTVL